MRGDYIEKIISRVGEIRKNTQGTPMKIITYREYKDIDVEFLDDHHFIKEHMLYTNFIRGNIKNPYDRILYGVGYIGKGKYTAFVDGHISQEYQAWIKLLQRCYDVSKKDECRTYFGICTVCDEWQNFQNFAEWYSTHKYECPGRLHLDKDILYPRNKVYCPEKCLLVPQRINMLFSTKPNDRGLPTGITMKSGKYYATYSTKDLGSFATLEEAYREYSKSKEETIKAVANEYKNIIPEEVYNALIAYKVDIHNDSNYVA